MIDIVVPVGPNPHNVRWLEQCLGSIGAQTEKNNQIVVYLINDGPRDAAVHINRIAKEYLGGRDFYTVTNPCNLGVAVSFKIGSALGSNKFLMWLASDDWLEPTAVELALSVYDRIRDDLGHYWLPINYWRNGAISEVARLSCMNAMICRALYNKIGGVPPEAAVGWEDTFYMNIMYAHFSDHMHSVAPPDNGGLWNHRFHDEQYCDTRRPLEGAIRAVRDHYIANWRPQT